MNKLTEEVRQFFGNKCQMTGNDIKTNLEIIYSKHGMKFYPSIKALEKFGYNLKRFLKDGKYYYEISRLES